MTHSESTPAPRRINPAVKMLIELGPLALFFLAYSKLGIYWATGVLMAGVVTTLAVSYAILRRFPIMPVVTAVIVVLFGSLTLYLHDEAIIKLKPTALYSLFSAALFIGLAFNRPILAAIFDGAFDLTAEGWRKLTWRWAFFFLAMALLNEAVWRTQTTEFWVGFKTFGFMPLTLAFVFAQTPLIHRYQAKEPESQAL